MSIENEIVYYNINTKLVNDFNNLLDNFEKEEKFSYIVRHNTVVVLFKKEIFKTSLFVFESFIDFIFVKFYLNIDEYGKQIH